MKLSTFWGIILGFAAILGAFLWEGGPIDSLFMLPAMLIVIGGTLAAGLAGSSFEQLFRIPKLIALAMNPPQYNELEIADIIVEYSTIARREGILALENKLDNLPNPFMKKLFKICIDGADSDGMQKIAENEIEYITMRHNANIDFFIKLGGYSPTMGIIGTVMGLISTLAAAGSEPSVLIKHISTAFIATLWGIVMANLVWLPVGDKLRNLHKKEIQIFQLMLDGVQSIQMGENPSVVRAKILSAFPISKQDALEEKQKAVQDSLAATLKRKDKDITITDETKIVNEINNKN